jgi:hypothetical protein
MIYVDSSVVLAELLASIEFLRAGAQEIELATYDLRLGAAARALGIPLVEL